MTVKRMDNVGIVVEDIDAAIEFFIELGLELEGRAPVEGAVLREVRGGIHVRTPRDRGAGGQQHGGPSRGDCLYQSSHMPSIEVAQCPTAAHACCNVR